MLGSRAHGKLNVPSSREILHKDNDDPVGEHRVLFCMRIAMACRLCRNDFFRDSCLVTATKAFHGDELFLGRRFYEVTILF